MKSHKNCQKEKTAVPGEWLYVAKEGVDVRRIAAALPDAYETELWEEAGVLEIVLAEKSSMDFEHARIHPKDELTRAFVENAGCSEVFLVTFAPEEYERVKYIMQQIMEQCGGLFCGDTEDFVPRVERQAGNHAK